MSKRNQIIQLVFGGEYMVVVEVYAKRASGKLVVGVEEEGMTKIHQGGIELTKVDPLIRSIPRFVPLFVFGRP